MKNKKLEIAHKVATDVVEDFNAQIQVGMTESQIYKKFLDFQKGKKYCKNWHVPKIRVGTNTLLPFDERSPQDVRLGTNDIYFIDLGLIIDGHESDYAKTFSTGNNLEMRKMADDCQNIWKTSRDYGIEKKVTGIQLYSFARKKAEEMGYFLDIREGGHPIGKFPHKRVGPQVLADFKESIPDYSWILEIKIINKLRTHGGFYEEIYR